MANEPVKPAVTTPPVVVTKPVTVMPTAFIFNTSAVKAKIKELRDHLQAYVGRPGFNAFTWMAKNLTPLEGRLNDGEKSETLQKAILSLECEEPIAKGAEHNIKNMPKEHQAAGRVDEKLASQQAAVVAHQLSPKIGS